MYEMGKRGIKNPVQLTAYVDKAEAAVRKAQDGQSAQTEAVTTLQQKNLSQTSRIRKLNQELQDLVKENQELMTAEFARQRELDRTADQVASLTAALQSKEREVQTLTSTSTALAARLEAMNHTVSKCQQTVNETESKGLQAETLLKAWPIPTK